MRTKHAMRNIISSLLLGGLVILMQFVLQWALADTLGAEYLGLNSLFMTTIALLAVAELGFGSAIIQQLYAPLKTHDWVRAGSLMRFYKTIYRIVAGLVLAAGLVLLPFLPAIVGSHRLEADIYVVFGLFLFNAIVSYMLSYRRSLLQADQRGYIIDIIYTATYIAVGLAQVLVLSVTHNYYLFLVGNILLTVASNIIINYQVGQRYPDVPLRYASPIDRKTKKRIFRQVKGLIFHKSASFIIPSSSNIIISVLLGLKAVGFASNYLLLSNAITMMTWKVSAAITASVGNLLVDASTEKLYRVHKNLQFGAAALGALVSVVFFVSVDHFIELWIGDEYALGWGMALVFACAIYLTVMRIVPNSFKQAAGIFYEDRYVPLIEAAINIIAALAGALIFGLEGVFLGLVVSSIFLHVYAYPKFVYRGVLELSPRRYILDIIPYVLATTAVAVISWALSLLIGVSGILGLVLISVVPMFVTAVVFYLLFSRSLEWAYYVELGKEVCKKIVRSGSRGRHY